MILWLDSTGNRACFLARKLYQELLVFILRSSTTFFAYTNQSTMAKDKGTVKW